MDKIFSVDGIEYFIGKKPLSSEPILKRVDEKEISNRKEICRRFLKLNGWTDEQLKNRTTNDLERKTKNILEGKISIPSDLSNKHESLKNKQVKILNDSKVILLNKPFLGGWLNKKGNIGHEIIDFLYTDNNDYYVYNNPWGVCPDDIWVEGTNDLKRIPKEKYTAKYLVLTSEERSKTFDILYVIELEEKLHRFHTSKDNNNPRFIKNQSKIKEIMRNRNITYNGRYLDEIYKKDDTLYLTFKAKKIYKAKSPILVEQLDYNFQRNKGYLYKDSNKKDYDYLEKLITDSISNEELVEFQPTKVNKSDIETVDFTNTFLDLIYMQYNEQVFTNILYSILVYKDILKIFCEEYKGTKKFDSASSYNVYRENKVINGRMDVCAEGKNQRIIIENKVYSGLNGIKPEDNITQLSTYYNWGKYKEIEPLCFIVAPNFRIAEIEIEIKKLDPNMKNIYQVLSYKQIADFIKKQYESNKLDENYKFYSLIPQIINAFKNLSYSTKEDLYARMFLKATMEY